METDNISLLLSLNEAIATIQRPEDLMGPIFDKIFKLYNSPVGGICIIENNQTHAFLVFCDTSTRRSKRDLFNSSDNWFGRYSIDELPLELNLRSDDIVQHEALKCISEKPEFDSYRRIVKEYNIEKIIQVPLRCSGNISGFLLFGIAGDNSSFIGEEKLEFIMQFANLIGVGIRNFMNYEELQKRELFQSTLLKITNDFVTIKDRNSMFERLAYEFHNPEIGKSFCNYAEAKLINFFSGDPVLLRFKQGEKFKHLTYGSGRDLFSILESLGIKNNETNGHIIIEHDELEQLRQRNANLDHICSENEFYKLYWEQYTTNDGCKINTIMGLMYTNFEPVLEISFTSQFLPQIAILFKNFAAYEEIASLKKQLEEEKVSLIDEISHQGNFQNIIGNSPIIQSVLYKVKQVASLDATVLILGETGTGKELVAHAIHNTSERKDKPMIKVNCATLPSQLIESELFGHEKGSFTGAVERRIGKFELANGGTIFLDEIGELPLELQAKLLRILQEKEFERIGGKQTIKINVRVIAATNRNLEDEVNNGKFRADLFYRLNVFPIAVPPLRKRKEDIPLFVRHFAEKYAKSMGRNVKEIAKTDLDAFMNYDWPGNIRELEHIVERAIITSPGTTLDFSDVKFLRTIQKSEDLSTFKTLVEMEKEYIISALKAANGKIMGENSASEILGINGKTLGSKMRKLGIKRQIIINS